jgi:hypothetical protein
MKTELANYMNFETEKLKAKQRAERKKKTVKPLTANELCFIRDMLEITSGDTELRKGFNSILGITTGELNRLSQKLSDLIMISLQTPAPKGCYSVLG